MYGLVSRGVKEWLNWDQDPIFLLEIGSIPFLGLDQLDPHSSYFETDRRTYLINTKSNAMQLTLLFKLDWAGERRESSSQIRARWLKMRHPRKGVVSYLCKNVIGLSVTKGL